MPKCVCLSSLRRQGRSFTILGTARYMRRRGSGHSAPAPRCRLAYSASGLTGGETRRSCADRALGQRRQLTTFAHRSRICVCRRPCAALPPGLPRLKVARGLQTQSHPVGKARLPTCLQGGGVARTSVPWCPWPHCRRLSRRRYSVGTLPCESSRPPCRSTASPHP